MALHRGDWVPLIPMRYRWPILFLLAAVPIGIGIDYLMGETPASLSAVERSAPIEVWGFGLVIAGSAILLGYILRWPRLTIAGLHICGTIEIVLAGGIGESTINLHDGNFRGPLLYLAFGLASWWAALGYSMQIGGPDRNDP